jgi:lipopolysaccharide transport system ATP-binding protein
LPTSSEATANVVIDVAGLGKRYRLGSTPGGYQTLRDAIASMFVRLRRRAPAESTETIWALRDVSFQVGRGQVLGIIGRNGAGKSTLLKVLARVTEPTEGEALIRGRVGSLLEVGTGFHPELSGRENVYMNGAILGMRRAEIDRKFDEIIEFAEVERFVDTPVKRYSSGMYLRLAFAVAAHLEPEILIVDEVLAVGDAEFQRKCLGKMSSVAQEGRTVLFVSHNMSAILRLTERCLVLESGRIAIDGPTAQAVETYLTAGQAASGERVWDGAATDPENPFRPLALRVLDGRGRIVDSVSCLEPFSVEFEYELRAEVTGLRVGLYLTTSRGDPVFTTFDTDAAERFESWTTRPAGRYVSRCRFPANLLNGGAFALGVNASAFRIRSFFSDERALTLTVDATGAPGSHWAEPRGGPLRPALAWDISELAAKP